MTLEDKVSLNLKTLKTARATSCATPRGSEARDTAVRSIHN